jgi:DNA mismatch repair protein MutL
MGVIVVLDEETINHIAAGEVVERAASVVKELVENAIDAGAKRIKIDLVTSKTAMTRVVVSDDGCGMNSEDALLAFHQHATSKITRPSDLAAISTLGFRGEAMASIAAVSKVTLTTKERCSKRSEATQVVIRGGKLVAHIAIGAPEGTSVVVEELFYNTPARQKFQKTIATELVHIYDILERLALAHRKISFVLFYQGKERFRTYGNDSYEDVIASVFGQSFVKELVPVVGTYGIVKVTGFITRPGCQMKNTSNRFYFSINRRQITSRALQWAVREGYGTLLPKKMYPAVFLDLEIDPRDVDVNVHPTKKEVRLSHERDVLIGVRDAVYCALHEIRIFASNPLFSRTSLESGDSVATKTLSLSSCVLGESPPPPIYGGLASSQISSTLAFRRTDKQLQRTGSFETFEMNDFVPEVLGQIADTYILARNETDDLVVIDQHAAHERVMYDLLLSQKELKLSAQELIVPLQLKLTKKEAVAVPELLPVLAEAGYTLELFGKDVWMVRTVPAVLAKFGDPTVVYEIISHVLDNSFSGGVESVLDRVLKTTACRAVVKGATPMTMEQMQRLICQLMATRSPYACPHGRPTTIVLTKEQLATMFLRT